MITWYRFFFNSPASNLIELVILIHDYVIITLLSVLAVVLIVIIYSLIRKFINLEFFEHHQLEGIWTVVPFVLLTFILIPSLKSLYMLDRCIFCGISVTIIGHQWYWRYFYKDLSHFFDSYITGDRKSLRLIDTDNRLIIPTLMPVRLIVSSADVIHSWSMPSFGVKIDAIPGRINQFCLSSKRSGIYFGQCSEICGANHSFMPIVVESINLKKFLNIL